MVAQAARKNLRNDILESHLARMPIIANPSAASVVRAMGFQGSDTNQAWGLGWFRHLGLLLVFHPYVHRAVGRETQSVDRLKCPSAADRREGGGLSLALVRAFDIYVCLHDARLGNLLLEHALAPEDVSVLRPDERLAATSFRDVPSVWQNRACRCLSNIKVPEPYAASRQWRANSGTLSSPPRLGSAELSRKNAAVSTRQKAPSP